MAKQIIMNFRGNTKEFESGTTVKEISEYYQENFNYPILLGKIDNELVELNEPLTRSYTIDFYDRSSGVGNSIYGRTLQFLMVVALNQLWEEAEVIIQFSIDKGFYCELKNKTVTKEDIEELQNKMMELSKEDHIINKMSVSRIDAIKFFKKKKQYDKVEVLKYISNTYINLYRIDKTYDYFYGKLAYSTGQIDDFKLDWINETGFVVSYPSSYNPECTLDYVHHQMMFDKFLEYSRWATMINQQTAADLNQVVAKGKYSELIGLAEVYYNNQLVDIASNIINNRNIKIILIAGPSSAGKTTTAKKLAIYLRSKGLKPYQISMDNYFLDREKTPKLANGELDTESLNCVDINLFNKQLMSLLDGEKVDLPTFNFVTGKREYNGETLKMDEDGIIIVEGLHCMNDELTQSIDRSVKYKIYITPLTQINIDHHNRVHTSDTRKLRRIVRDNRYRGYKAYETLDRWKNIREGEEKYIFPYQDDADYVVNSALLYELGILKTYVEPLLFNVPEDNPNYPEAIRLINLLRNFLPIPSEDVPADSVLREFIGRSAFYK